MEKGTFSNIFSYTFRSNFTKIKNNRIKSIIKNAKRCYASVKRTYLSNIQEGCFSFLVLYGQFLLDLIFFPFMMLIFLFLLAIPY